MDVNVLRPLFHVRLTLSGEHLLKLHLGWVLLWVGSPVAEIVLWVLLSDVMEWKAGRTKLL